jgi:tetratricopeptide (TPR) repeat protein
MEDYHDLERQARLYWGLSLAHRATGEDDQAKLYATRALYLYEAQQNRSAAAAISLNLAEILVGQQEYATARQLLDRARTFLTGTGDTLLLSTLHQNYASLAQHEGRLADARAHVEQAIQLSAPDMAEGSLVKPEVAAVLRTRAQAQHTAAQVAAAQGEWERAAALFQQALATIAETDFSEAAYEINFSYAEALQARGAFEQAMIYYRAAAQQQHRPGRSRPMSA